MKVIDHIGHKVILDTTKPLRIVSLVPSQTELLFTLGLGEEVVGITKFCVHPQVWFKAKTRIGGTKNPKLEVIKDLQPTFILANKEENNRADVEVLQKDYTVWTSDIKNVEDAYKMITDIGLLVGKTSEANQLVTTIKQTLIKPIDAPKSALYAIWYNPWMFAGTNTYINEMISFAGLHNALKAERYPSLTTAEIAALNPEVILLSSEPYPFKDKHIQELQNLLPDAKIELVDGEIFSWYGSRLIFAGKYCKELQQKLMF
jgi:ABC-type Fe3+-hydroxamate transport system substrate-binding protein